MEKLYTASVKATGGREGRLVSSDNVLNLTTVMPKELGGQGGAATNPEQLFAAGYAACFESALNMVCRMKKVSWEGTEVTAHVTIGKEADGGYGLEVKLDVLLKGVDEAQARELIGAAHETCPYSKAIEGNIPVELNML
ncbi:organic hydroperoxide resistance protein [Shouchella clausii]